MDHQQVVQEERQQQVQERPKHQPKNQANKQQGRVTIDFYTDPLCCWSWAFEQPWRQLLSKYRERIEYRYVMGGMIPDWNSYSDPLNAVSKPLQMGPVWMHASEVTHTKMRYDIWHLDPPSSSYPACIAVKTAALQSQDAADQYLLLLREALMERGENISKPAVLITCAQKIVRPDFDFHRFKNDWVAGAGKKLFRSDLEKAKFHNIGRFPTLTFVNDKGQGIMIVGYRPFDVLEQAFLTISKTDD